MKTERYNVLLIEDGRVDAEIIKRSLRDVNATIALHTETTLEAGLASLEYGDFDVVLSDLTLPDSDGLETVSRIRQQDRNVPIVVLTSREEDELALELLDAGAQDYIVKGNFTNDDLERAMRYAIQRQQNYARIRELLGEVQQSQELLERKNKKLDALYTQAHEFVDNVSHEFRTPLAVIKEFVSLIRDGVVGDVTDEQQRMLNIVEDRADDLNIMVDDMLDVSKLEAGMLGAWRKDCSVDDIIERIKTSLERKAAVKNVVLKWEIDEDVSEVYGDPEKIGRVITNLAINAVKFSGDAGTVRIGVQADMASQDIVFSVIDSGPGIDEESLATIFRRFKQLTTEIRGSTKGFGLGLNIAKELVDLNFGEINVASDVGVGSTFSFTVPMAVPTEVMRRYVRRIRRVEQIEHGAPHISLVTAEISVSSASTVADDVDAFLNYCLRKNDLLLRASQFHWVVALPEPINEAQKYIDRIEKEWQTANRNRVHEPLPAIAMNCANSWRATDGESEIIGVLETLLQSNLVPSSLR